jgi:hypothetical protein
VMAADLVHARTEQTWWEAVCSRLDPPTQWAFVVERGRRRKDLDDRLASDVFVQAASYALVKRLPPPSFGDFWQIFHTARGMERAWRAVVIAFVSLGEERFSSTDVLQTLNAIHVMPDKFDRKILHDLLVCRILAASDQGVFNRAMTEVERYRGSPEAATLLLQAVTSLPKLNAATVARLVIWGVRTIGCTNSPGPVATALDVQQVRELVERTKYDVPDSLRDYCDNKQARRWLEQVAARRRRGWLR